MKKIIVIFLIFNLCLNINAKENEPKYKIIANSNHIEDIKEMYKIKNELLIDYKDWIKSVDDVNQVLYDHQYVYNAKYSDGIYTIVLGDGNGKELNGSLKSNYCENTTEIKKKSFIWDFFFK